MDRRHTSARFEVVVVASGVLVSVREIILRAQSVVTDTLVCTAVGKRFYNNFSLFQEIYALLTRTKHHA